MPLFQSRFESGEGRGRAWRIHRGLQEAQGAFLVQYRWPGEARDHATGRASPRGAQRLGHAGGARAMRCVGERSVIPAAERALVTSALWRLLFICVAVAAGEAIAYRHDVLSGATLG